MAGRPLEGYHLELADLVNTRIRPWTVTEILETYRMLPDTPFLQRHHIAHALARAVERGHIVRLGFGVYAGGNYNAIHSDKKRLHAQIRIEVLAHLAAEAGYHSLKSLARELRYAAGDIREVVLQLEREDMVERPYDRRRSPAFCLTEKGHSLQQMLS